MSYGNEKDVDKKTSFLSLASEKIGFAAMVSFGCFIALAFLPYPICFTIAFYSALLCMVFCYVAFLMGICAFIAIFISKKLKGYKQATMGILLCVIFWFLLGMFYHPWLEKKRTEHVEIGVTKAYKKTNP